MTARPWLRHPPRTIPAPACPTGQPRYTSHHHAALALLPGRTTLPITPTQCPLPECRGGWHHTRSST